jgi:3-methyladenine DNA glycosylase AlkD
MARISWEIPFLEALGERSAGSVLDVLQGQCTDHAGTPSAAVKLYALKLTRKQYKQTPQHAYQLGVELALSGDATGEELGVMLLAEHYALSPEEADEMMHRLADSENWEVREWAASACGHVLTEHFDHFYPVMETWVRDASGNVRRAVALAVKYAGKSRREEFAEPLLDLLDPLLADRDPYVKKNLGAYAIGDGLLRYYPENTVRRLQRWIMIDDETVRWNLATVFKSAEGAKQADRALEVLQLLHADERAAVNKAWQAALKNLTTRRPDLVERLLSGHAGRG